MSAKKALGIKDCPLNDAEIMRIISDARKRHENVVEIPSGGKVVRIRLKKVAPEGLMRQWRDYYAK